ncbi:MAG TPA: type II toxin-antitoxin system RelE/ParE family toxin [Polyangiaceae bacterium]|nr:type II toxin-antitoxin system RelE/ParE family toxin [Polyangiaceae bacterium]
MDVVLTSEAQLELDHAAAWYDERHEGLGDEFVDEVQDALATILETPETWSRWPGAPARIPAVRRFVLPRFPYSIAYQVHIGRVVVLAVVHARKRPLYWIARL